MWTSWRQYANDHPRVVDAALVVLLVLAESGTAVLNSNLPEAVGNLGWSSAFPLAAAASLALLWRRSHPRTVVLFTALCVTAMGGVGYMITPVNLAPLMIALYELTMRVPGKTTRLYCLGVTAVIVAAAVLGNQYGYPWPLVTISPILFLLLPLALGSSARLRAEYAARSREEEARHRVAEERLRIARELHDVVAHHMALANAQAGTAAYLARSRPDQVQQILTELTGTTSTALRELKATVGLLRHTDDTSSPLEPPPGLNRLPDLTASFASAGLTVEVTIEGTQQPLSPDVDLAAFRIIQEALTNVTKHAKVDTATVRLSYHDNQLTITVDNHGKPATVGAGFGLIGMRERARSAGGQLHAGPRPEGGFTVTTELPVMDR
ncbi:sensor histidine kinase [Kibdelosporangium aridum]|uniref:histidine kinase n=1 Tax=Kibdelosporangium aridum TaxID=2030 RepID=A0A428ZRN5_KIBAR|nr:sensor histidine kinase [Kibdelosporangium aridum]RSM90651.1 sensor histidine kinase [Kibdelosporangium aridum]